MSIRFTCTTCGQRLSVGTHRAGQQSTCPKCKTTLAIPLATSEQPVVATTPRTPQRTPMATVALTDPPVEEPVPVAEGAKREHASELDVIAVPRYVIFAQGFLLAFVGILCFLIGLAMGGGFSPAKTKAAEGTHVSGMVALLEKGKRVGDVGSMVVLLPLDATPETVGSLVGLRPGDGAQLPQANEFLKTFGGVSAKCDDRGRFEMQSPKRGKHYLLVISSTGSLRGPMTISQQQLGQMSKFFDMANEPLEKFRFQWRIENIRSDAPLNIDFD